MTITPIPSISLTIATMSWYVFPKAGGIASLARVTKDLLRSLEFTRNGQMSGIGGRDKHVVKLGNVVLRCVIHIAGGLIPYNFGRVFRDQVSK